MGVALFTLIETFVPSTLLKLAKSVGVKSTERVCPGPAFKSVPNAGLYTKVPGTEAVAFNSAALKALPKVMSAGLAQVIVGVTFARLPPISTAPISQVKLIAPWTGRTTPRWSVASQAPLPLPAVAGLPASIAGLPARRVKVKVGPPLFVSGPRFAFIGIVLEPSLSPMPALILQPVVLPIRLWPPEVRTPSQSGRLKLPEVLFPEIMLFARLTVPPFDSRPVACCAPMLLVMVKLLRFRLPFFSL